jgi:GNAT superfamily N-acetyltransferase
MTTIRPMDRDDLPLVAALLPDWASNQRGLGAAVLDYPWADEELPSLVAVDDDDGVIGFIGSQVRRMQFDGREIRGVCCTQLAVAPEHRGGPAGARLLRQLVSGPQEVTWSDGATDPVRRVWQALGGHLDYPRAADFFLLLRPARWLAGVGRALAKREPVGREQIPVGGFPFAALGQRLNRREPVDRTGITGADAVVAAIVESQPEIWPKLRVGVEWDEPQLKHVFAEVDGAVGPLVSRVVRRNGRPIAWYAYLLRPGGISKILHFAAAERDAEQAFADLVDHARSAGSAGLAGRAEPHLEETLRHRLAVLGLARQPILHAKDPELAAALATGSALLTRLAGEVFVP